MTMSTTQNQIFFIRSKEESCCPICNGSVTVRDTRDRKVIDDSGTRKLYRLRRLKCRSCNKLHIELPDSMIPYKHYEAAVIEAALDGTTDSCPADNSTIQRWQIWLRQLILRADSTLRSLWSSYHQKNWPLFDRSSLLQKLRKHYPGWLRSVHVLLTKTGFGVHTQFAWPRPRACATLSTNIVGRSMTK